MVQSFERHLGEGWEEVFVGDDVDVEGLVVETGVVGLVGAFIVLVRFLRRW